MPNDDAVALIEPGPSLADLREWPVLDRLDKTRIGVRTADGITRVRCGEPPDCLLYGPFWQLAAGDYRLAFECRAERPLMPAQPVLGVEVIAFDRFQFAWRDFTAAELRKDAPALDFAVPAGDGDGPRFFEFRFFHLGNADLTIAAVSLRRLPIPAPAAPRRWRLLGRLRRDARGRVTPDGIAVRRAAGCALFEVQPYLQLPAGTYRLTIAADARRPAPPGAAVAAVEIVAQSKWRRPRPSGWRRLIAPLRTDGASLAATQFAAGEAAVEFAVPPELSLDRGQGARLQVKLTPLGNASLLIRAVEITQSAAAAPEPAPVRRAAGRCRLIVVGNCQAQLVHAGFCRVDGLSARFDARYHFVDLPPELHEAGKRELAEAEILFVQDIQDWRRYPLRDCVPAQARIVEFPLLRFASLWPFDHYNGLGDRQALAQEWPNVSYIHLDGLLGRLRREIPDPEARFRAYRDLAVDSLVDCRRLHDFEERRLIAMDRKFAGGIGAFILDGFRRRRLFHTTVHPSGEVMARLLRLLAARLEVVPGTFSADRLDQLNYLEVPVHPLVAAALGVRWAGARTLYNCRGEKLTWEAYVRRYIAHYG
jgi:hypothetical protein